MARLNFNLLFDSISPRRTWAAFCSSGTPETFRSEAMLVGIEMDDFASKAPTITAAEYERLMSLLSRTSELNKQALFAILVEGRTVYSVAMDHARAEARRTGREFDEKQARAGMQTMYARVAKARKIFRERVQNIPLEFMRIEVVLPYQRALAVMEESKRELDGYQK